MTTCTFETAEPGLQQCTVCGGPQPMGLGDMVAGGLAYVGITKERVAALVGGCGCDQRQEALNEWGRAVGIGLPARPENAQSEAP